MLYVLVIPGGMPLQCFKDFLLQMRTYVLQIKASKFSPERFLGAVVCDHNP